MNGQSSIPASVLVYLFAEQFSEPAKGLAIQGAIAPRSGEKLNAKPLVMSLYVSAIMELVSTGAARLETIEVKKFLGKETVQALALDRQPVEKVSAMAMQIARCIQAASKPEQRRVREVIISAIGGRSSTYYPWLVSLGWVMGEAQAAGLIQRPEQKPNLLKAMFNPTESLTRATAVAGSVDPLQGELAGVKARLAAFEQSLGPAAAQLRKEIEKGIEECVQRSSD